MKVDFQVVVGHQQVVEMYLGWMNWAVTKLEAQPIVEHSNALLLVGSLQLLPRPLVDLYHRHPINHSYFLYVLPV